MGSTEARRSIAIISIASSRAIGGSSRATCSRFRNRPTRHYGERVTSVDTIDINPRVQPTFVCDLAEADRVLAANAYDCVLLPNTLSVLRDVPQSLRQMLRTHKPGGVLLAASSMFVPLIPDGPDCWRLSEAGWREVILPVLQGHEVEIEARGNCWRCGGDPGDCRRGADAGRSRLLRSSLSGPRHSVLSKIP